MEDKINGYSVITYLDQEHNKEPDFRLNLLYFMNLDFPNLSPSLNFYKKKVNLESTLFAFCLDKKIAESFKKEVIERGFAYRVDIEPILEDFYNL